MADRKRAGLQALLNTRQFLPSPADLLKPFPPPKKGELVMQGVTADVLTYAVGFIPAVGDIVGQFVNDNIMADLQQKLSEPERTEFRAQNRIYPNGIALLRTFQRTGVLPGSRV